MPQIRYVAPPDSEEVWPPSAFDAGNSPQWLAIGPTKIFSDGALTTRTAALREPYADDESNKGLLIWEPEMLAGMVRRAHAAGWQIGTHAIGDRAVELVVDCYEQALSAAPRPDHRHRIEHCMLLDEELGRRIKQLGVVPTIQAGFMARLGDAYVAALGMERASRLMPMQLFERLGIPIGFSSDRPVIPGLPLQGISAAVTRRTPSGQSLGPEHAVSPLQAIRYYTVGSAFAGHLEGERGTLRPGMLADFTVLSHHPAEGVPDDLAILMTVAGGVVSYSV
jgi:predicted amidohydrolase YtcJ